MKLFPYEGDDEFPILPRCTIGISDQYLLQGIYQDHSGHIASTFLYCDQKHALDKLKSQPFGWEQPLRLHKSIRW